MSARKSSDPNWIDILVRVYASALWLYPREHRERWGTDMQQAFRDRCREAARAGRGPWSVLFTELLPDVATSAGHERFDAFQEAPPMKRLALIALVLAFVSAVLLHAQITPALDAAHAWWREYQATLDQRSLDDHETTLAALVEQRGAAHAEVIAAQLYWSAGNGYRLRFSAEPGLHLTASETAASDALLDRADAAFTHALRANDTWALWLAAMSSNCPARANVCRTNDAFNRLREIDADNGAVWVVELQRAADAKDVPRQRMALARLAHASQFDWHFGDGMRGMLAAFALRPLPRRLWQSYENGEKATPEGSATLMAGSLGSMNGVVSMPAYQPLMRFCLTPDEAIKAERSADCRAAGRLLAGNGTGMIDVSIGNTLLLRTANPDERTQTQQHMRDMRWRLQQYATVGPDRSADAARHWRAAWMGSHSEVQVYERLLRERGIPQQAPADFKLESRIPLPPDSAF